MNKIFSQGIQQINRNDKVNSNLHLNLKNFKSKPCTISAQHAHKQCPFFHNVQDRKRNMKFCSTEMCESMSKFGNCPNDVHCEYPHNMVEQLYQPQKYKTRFCSYYPNNINQCEYGKFCSFAHSESDVKIELIQNYELDDDFYMFHFKTVFCPYNVSNHDKSQCVYAHNWQDYRRKPDQYTYTNGNCQNWNNNNFITNYNEGCTENGVNCNYCHGWKEYEYHPLNYKTKPCPNGLNCQKKQDCSYFHNFNECRDIDQQVTMGVFQYQAKNRQVLTKKKLLRMDSQNYENNSINSSNNKLIQDQINNQNSNLLNDKVNLQEFNNSFNSNSNQFSIDQKQHPNNFVHSKVANLNELGKNQSFTGSGNLSQRSQLSANYQQNLQNQQQMNQQQNFNFTPNQFQQVTQQQKFNNASNINQLFNKIDQIQMRSFDLNPPPLNNQNKQNNYSLEISTFAPPGFNSMNNLNNFSNLSLALDQNQDNFQNNQEQQDDIQEINKNINILLNDDDELEQ